jgi:hypothetical protein
METMTLLSNLTPWGPVDLAYVPLPYVDPMSNIWCGEMAGERTMTETVHRGWRISTIGRSLRNS